MREDQDRERRGALIRASESANQDPAISEIGAEFGALTDEIDEPWEEEAQ